MYYSFTSSALLLLATSSQAILISARSELFNCLQSSLSSEGSIISPNDALFANDTIRFSDFNAPSFILVSKISNEDDARASINCAKKTGTPFLFTGPRHGFDTGLSKLQNGLEILTTSFNRIDVEPETNTMTVGGAVRFQDVANALYAVKKNIPVGGGPCVGIVGAALGAGIGRLEGLYGLIADSLLSVRLMLPNTTVIDVSAQTNPDLFWGLKGAGFNFGFVLNATFRVYDEVPDGQNYNADFEFPYTIAETFYQALKDEASKLPPPLCVATSLAWSPTYNQTTLKVNAVYAGPEREGIEAVRFLHRLNPILRQNSTVVPWNQLTQNSFFGNGNDAVLSCVTTLGERSVFGAAFNEVNVKSNVNMTEQFNYLVTQYPQMRVSDNSMYFCATQAVRAQAKNSTAYALREALGHQTWGYQFPDNTTNDASIMDLPEKMRDTIAETAGTDGLKVYIGFSQGDEPLESIFAKENLPRLAALKKEYDPEGLFNAYHPLPTSYP